MTGAISTGSRRIVTRFPCAAGKLASALLPYMAGFAAAAALLCLAAAGYSGYDDRHDIEAADGWLAHIPFVGTTHWHMRHPLVLAIAASFAAFGRNETSLMLPTIAAYLGVVALTAALVRSVSDRFTAGLAALLAASVPLFVIYAKTPYPDDMELALALLSLLLFWHGAGRRSAPLLLLAGSAAGISWLLRATCAPLLIFYAGLFLLGWRVRRADCVWLLLGFVPFPLCEWAFLYAAVGDPFYRLAIDSRSLEIPSEQMTGWVAGGLHPPFNMALMAKWKAHGIHAHWAVDPYIDFVTNPIYGPIFWTGALGAVAACRQPARAGVFARLVCVLAALWIFCVTWVLNLSPQPRYFGPAVWAAAVMTAFWLRPLFASKPRVAAAVLAAILAVDVLAISLRQPPLRAERALADCAAGSAEPMWTNLSQGVFLLEEIGVAGRVHFSESASVPPGGLYVTTGDAARRQGIAGWSEVPCGALRSRHWPGLAAMAPELWARMIPSSGTGVLVLRAPGRTGSGAGPVPSP